MKTIRFIGDVHGKYAPYKKILKESPFPTIQVGDMGVGFRKLVDRFDGVATLANPPYDSMVENTARFIRGNHDNPTVCKNHTQYIPDGTVEGSTMFIGGGLSIDKAWRTEGYDWWPDEELSQREFDPLLDVYAVAKPKLMVTHDCPEVFADVIIGMFNMHKLNMPSITRQCFDMLLKIHRPKVWVFGHWHHSVDVELNGTRFICLNELETIDLEMED